MFICLKQRWPNCCLQGRSCLWVLLVQLTRAQYGRVIIWTTQCHLCTYCTWSELRTSFLWPFSLAAGPLLPLNGYVHYMYIFKAALQAGWGERGWEEAWPSSMPMCSSGTKRGRSPRLLNQHRASRTASSHSGTGLPGALPLPGCARHSLAAALGTPTNTAIITKILLAQLVAAWDGCHG